MALKKTTIIRLLFGVLTFAVLFVVFKPRDILAALAGADARYVVSSILLMFLVIAIRAYRWQMVLRDIGIAAGFFQLLEMTLVSNYFNMLLPGSIGGDVYRVVDSARATSKKLRPLAAVVIERITGVISLILVCAIAIVVYRDMLPGSAWAHLLMAAALLATTLALLAVISQIERILPLLLRILPKGIAARVTDEKATAVCDVIRELRGNRRVFLRSILNGFILQGVVLLTYYTASLALHRDIPLMLFFVFFPLIELVSMVPITINGIGVKEGLLVYFMEYAQVPPSYSMSLGILYRLLAAVVALAGGVLLVMRKNHPDSSK